MAEIQFQNFTIQYSQDMLTIIDSYKIHDVKKIKQSLKEILKVVPLYKTNRSINSLTNEWIAHNFLYKCNLYKNHTKDCDFESKQKIHITIIYFILSMINKIQGGFLYYARRRRRKRK